MNVGLFIAWYVAGRVASWQLYQACWNHGVRFGAAGEGALWSLRRQPWAWLSLAVWAALVWGVEWQDLALLRPFASTGCAVLALGAVGRLGPSPTGSLRWVDRVLVGLLAWGVWFSPALVLPSVVASCCLQYATVAGWRLGPGYSNLLGFEFVRGSCAVLAVCLAVRGLLDRLGVPALGLDAHAMAVVLAFQASSYVNQALAKSALGPAWHGWIRHNRVQCLVVNAWLRGWGGGLVSKAAILRLAGWLARWRIVLCLAAWSIELAWWVVLADRDVAVGVLSATLGFHLVVFLLTGLAAWANAVNHAVLLALVFTGRMDGVFGATHAWAAAACVALTAPCLAWVRLRIAREIREQGAASRWGRFGDAADLWMAWWDSPYMRMYSYRARMADGRRLGVSVRGFAPHDTALTDLHTHIMHLGLHDRLDPGIAVDRRVVRSGVWGLLGEPADRDWLYARMDARPLRLESLVPAAEPPWVLGGDAGAGHPAAALRDHFRQVLRARSSAWIGRVPCWPHVPGEDLVPDLCPLGRSDDGRFRFDQPVVALEIWRVKTFQTGDDIRLLEEVLVGSILLGEAPPDAS